MTTPVQPPDLGQLFDAFVAAARARVQTESTQPATASGMQKRLFTPREAGEYLGRTESAVRQMIHRKQLPVIRFGRNVRVDRHDLDRMIDEFRM